MLAAVERYHAFPGRLRDRRELLPGVRDAAALAARPRQRLLPRLQARDSHRVVRLTQVRIDWTPLPSTTPQDCHQRFVEFEIGVSWCWR